MSTVLNRDPYEDYEVRKAIAAGTLTVPVTSEQASLYRLADAVTAMTTRYGEAERRCAYAYMRRLRHLGTPQGDEDMAESDRWGRAARRRYAAVVRLASALSRVAQ